MHIILALLGTLVTILVLVHRLKDAGIDLGALNPFHWYHRQQWKAKVNADPLFNLSNPMEVASALIYTAAKLSGELSAEQKSLILDIYEQDFKLNAEKATELLSSNAYLIKDEDKIFDELETFVDTSLGTFSEAQKQSCLALIDKVIAVEERVYEKQQLFRRNIAAIFEPPQPNTTTWH